jgi:hypothetical protein
MRWLLVLLLLAAAPAHARLPHGAAAPPSPPISPSITPTASSIVATWTTSGASNSTAGCSTTPGGPYTILAVDNGIETSVTSHFIVVAGLVPSTTYYCQVVSGAASALFTQATNALPTTTPLIGATIGSATQPVTNQVHGDFFNNCVSNNGTTYLGTDDTGTGWSPASTSSAMSINQLISTSPLTGATLNSLTNFGPSSVPDTDNKTSKEISVFCDRGNIYALYSRINVVSVPYSFTYGSILKSADHAVSWSNGQAPNTYNVNGAKPPLTYTQFANSSIGASCDFVHYGPDDGTLGYPDNADAYAYFFCNDGVYNGTTDHFYALRIPRQSLPGLDGSAIQYYIGGSTGNGIDGSLDGAWSTSATGISILYSANIQLGVPRMAWMKTTGRYVLVDAWNRVSNTPGDTDMDIWESVHPWSIPTLISGPTRSLTFGFYGHVAWESTMGNATCNSIPMTFFTAGDYTNNAYYDFWTLPITLNC